MENIFSKYVGGDKKEKRKKSTGTYEYTKYVIQHSYDYFIQLPVGPHAAGYLCTAYLSLASNYWRQQLFVCIDWWNVYHSNINHLGGGGEEKKG